MNNQKGFLFIATALLFLSLASIFLLSWYVFYGSLTNKSQFEVFNPTEEELAKVKDYPLCDGNQAGAGGCILGVTTSGLPTSNSLPTSGYRRQRVQTDRGIFTIDIVAADLNSTRVIVDTASDSDCPDNCPVLSLKDYVSRSGAYAGINGPYFCPATYSSCANKKNSFDTLLMNKNKTYFNSSNNVYSNVPAVIFQGNSARFVQRSLEWGRDTSPDAVIANYPLLVFNSQINFTGGGEAKLNGKGARAFIGTRDNMVYIGVVHGASAADSAKTLHTLGMQNALNLDSGGSTALWNGGYKVGPGRGLPFAILFKVK